MKYTSLISILALAILVMACKAKKIPHEEADATAINILSSLDSAATADMNNATTPKDSLFASIERTPCFGMCPIYKMHIYKSGFVRYEGKNFVDHLGLYYTWSDQAVLDQIKAKAEEIKFYDFDDTYDGKVTDLPTTYLTMNYNGEKKRIKMRYNVPDELNAFAKYIDDLYKKVNWTRLEEKPEEKE